MASYESDGDLSGGLIGRQTKRKEAERSAREARKAEILSRQEWRDAWEALCGRATDTVVIPWSESREPLAMILGEIIEKRGFGLFVERIEIRIDRWFRLENQRFYKDPVQFTGDAFNGDPSDKALFFENIQAVACVLRRAIRGMKPMVPVGMCFDALRSTIWEDLRWALDYEISNPEESQMQPKLQNVRHSCPNCKTETIFEFHSEAEAAEWSASPARFEKCLLCPSKSEDEDLDEMAVQSPRQVTSHGEVSRPKIESLPEAALNAIVAGGLAGVLTEAGKLPAAKRHSKTMMGMLKTNSDYYRWSLDDWCQHLEAGKKTLLETDAWDHIKNWREENKRDRLGE